MFSLTMSRIPLRGLVEVQPERPRRLPHRLLGRRRVELHLAPEKRRREPAEHHVGVGHGRPVPAPAVAGGAGSGPRALRPYPQRPGHRDVAMEPAARAHAVHLDRRHLDRVVAERGLARDVGLSVLDEGTRRWRCPPCRSRGRPDGRRARRETPLPIPPPPGPTAWCAPATRPRGRRSSGPRRSGRCGRGDRSRPRGACLRSGRGSASCSAPRRRS